MIDKITINLNRSQLQVLFRLISLTEPVMDNNNIRMMILYFKKKLMIRIVKYLADEQKTEVNLKLIPAEAAALHMMINSFDYTQMDDYSFVLIQNINDLIGAKI